MRFWQIVFSLRELISEGQKWRCRNIVGTTNVQTSKFSFLQILGLIMAGLFVYKNPRGVSETEIDFLLSSLSIMTGFFFAVIFLSYDQFTKIEMPTKSDTDETKIKIIKSMNFLKQYNALSCYAILLSVIVIIMLVSTLLYGKQESLSGGFAMAKSFEDIEWGCTIRFYALLFWRFCMIYFLIDFFIITIYAICSLFQFINLRMLDSKCPYRINDSHVESDYHLYKRRYGSQGLVSLILVLIIMMIFMGVVVFW